MMKTLKEYIEEQHSTFEHLFANNISYDFLNHFDREAKEDVAHIIKEKYGDLMIAEDYGSMAELQQEVRLALRSSSWGINRYWRVINVEYNPLDNYDRTETHTLIYAEDKTTNAYGIDKTSLAYGQDKTTNAYGQDKTTIAYAEDKTTTSTEEVKEHHKLAGIENSDTLQVVPFDSSIPMPTNVNLHNENERENTDWTDEYDVTNTRNARSDTNTRDARSDTNTRDAHTDTNTRDAHSDTVTRNGRTDTETINAHGNIGTTRSQEMVSDEMSLALRNYNEFLARTIIEDITIPIFD